MYDIILTNVKNTHEYEELIKVFLRPQQYKLECIEDVALIKGRKDALCFCGTDDKNALKKEIYKSWFPTVTASYPSRTGGSPASWRNPAGSSSAARIPPPSRFSPVTGYRRLNGAVVAYVDFLLAGLFPSKIGRASCRERV